MNTHNRKIKIIADIDIPFLEGVLEDVADVIYLKGAAFDKDVVKDADALIIRTRTKCDESLLKDSKVKFIAAASIGYDHIDTDYCAGSGIEWTNAPGCNSASVEQYILSVLLTLAEHYNFKLSDKTIGIVGVGQVGSKVEKICKALGMRVLLNDPPRSREEGQDGFVEIEEIQVKADIISLHVPLNISGIDKTFHLVSEVFFNSVRENTILINSSRGEVVDGKALKQALNSGRIGSAVLDVWEGEPDIDLELLSTVEIATPHIAGYSADGKANATGMSVRALSRFFNLGMDDWEPADLPEPEKPEIILDGTGMELGELLLESCSQAYDVMRDDEVLRANPSGFEKQRATYPVRRESRAFRVKIINDQPGAGPILEKLGFQVLSDNCM